MATCPFQAFVAFFCCQHSALAAQGNKTVQQLPYLTLPDLPRAKVVSVRPNAHPQKVQ